jgi:hypothetical protein
MEADMLPIRKATRNCLWIIQKIGTAVRGTLTKRLDRVHVIRLRSRY